MTSKKIFTLISDNEIKSDMENDLRKRTVDQKFSYLEKGSQLFYDQNKKIQGIQEAEDVFHYETFFSHIENRKSILLVSFGCGNSYHDIPLLQALIKKGLPFSYIGVDYSYDMLVMAEKTMQENDIPEDMYSFCCADITNITTVDYIKNKKTPYDTTILLFLGGTFGVINHLDMIDVFYSMIHKNDFLLLDCQRMRDKKPGTLVKFFERMDHHLINEVRMTMLSHALTILDIPRDHGIFGIQSEKHIFAGALTFKYFFNIQKKFEKKINNLTLHFLPGEKITFFTPKFYYLPDLENFMEDHEFFLVEKDIKKTEDYTGICLYLYTK